MTTADEFFEGGGGSAYLAVKFTNPGDTVAGEVVRVSDPFTRPRLGKPNETENTIIIEIAQDPGRTAMTKEGPTGGTVALYVSKVALKIAIANAVREAGATGAPKVGGRLGIQRTADLPPKEVGMSPTQQFVAQYVPPTVSPQTNAIFNDTPATPAAHPAPQAPPAMAAATPTAAPAGPLV